MQLSYKNIICGKDVLIIGSGYSIVENFNSIKKYIEKKNPVIFGINNMTGFFIPEYHLWTNKQRYRDLGGCVKKESHLMFSYKIPTSLIRKHWQGDYYSVVYYDDKKYTRRLIITEDGVLKGFFRNAGSLAVALSHVMGAKEINLVGIDGFSLYKKEELIKNNKNQHCYGKGFTDDATYNQCVEKDKYIYDSYITMHEFGIEFKILTKTKYEKFYDGSVLES